MPKCRSVLSVCSGVYRRARGLGVKRFGGRLYELTITWAKAAKPNTSQTHPNQGGLAAFSPALTLHQNLDDMGLTVVPFGQGFKDMSPPTKELMKLVL